MENCLFCKIAKGEIPCEKIYEDEHTLAFLDIKPLNEGHTLVIPKAHSENILSIESAPLSHVMETVRRIAPVIKDATGASGVNIHSNNGASAGQVVFHTHIHIIPRHERDGYKHWAHPEHLAVSLKETQEKILSTLRK
jgi:histidine triad (HIT) family protein